MSEKIDPLEEARVAAEKIAARPTTPEGLAAERAEIIQKQCCGVPFYVEGMKIMHETEVQLRIALYAAQHFPDFAPRSGICWKCRRQVFEIEDGTSLVTACPHCHKSFVD